MNRGSHCIEILGLDVKQKKINIRSHNICIKINEDKMQYALIFSKPREKNIDISTVPMWKITIIEYLMKNLLDNNHHETVTRIKLSREFECTIIMRYRCDKNKN